MILLLEALIETWNTDIAKPNLAPGCIKYSLICMFIYVHFVAPSFFLKEIKKVKADPIKLLRYTYFKTDISIDNYILWNDNIWTGLIEVKWAF